MTDNREVLFAIATTQSAVIFPESHARHSMQRVLDAPVAPRPEPSQRLPCPTVSDSAAPPIRSEGHTLTSIATVRAQPIVAEGLRLPRCPCYQQRSSGPRSSPVTLPQQTQAS
jgi:hypothetical protein